MQKCECLDGLKCSGNHSEPGSQCRNLDGQMALFSDQVITVREQDGLKLCDSCLIKPIVEPANLDYSAFNREKRRLSAQDTLFDFR